MRRPSCARSIELLPVTLALRKDPLNRLLERRGSRVLRHERGRAILHGRRLNQGIVERRDDHDIGLRYGLPHGAAHGETVDVRQHEIDEKDIGSETLDGRDRVLTIGHARHHFTGGLEHAGERHEHRRMIVGNHDSGTTLGLERHVWRIACASAGERMDPRFYSQRCPNGVISSTPNEEIRILRELLPRGRISILKFGQMKALGLLLYLVTIPATALAQGSIAGRVTDSAGVPVSGVAVEAISDALIETKRTTSTDGAGQYRIEELRPGMFRVRFTVAGWKPHLRERVEVTGPLTVIVNAKLTVDAGTESITVSSQPPIIAVRSAKRAITHLGDVVASIPTARSYNALLTLVPGVVTSGNDLVTGPAATAFPFHGGRQNEGRLLLDGLNIGSPPSGNSATIYDVDVGQAQEVTFTMSGGLGESETGGLVMNIVPRTGGNTMRGSLFASGTGERFQSDVSQSLIAQGVIPGAPYTKVYDISGTLGGAVVTDRLWYVLSAHTSGSTRNSTTVYYNRNAGSADRWLYAPDTTRPSYSDRTFESISGRLTWQPTPRNKVSGYWNAQALCRSCTGATPGVSEPQRVSPEAVGVLGRRLDVTQVTWLSPPTDRVLLEAGYGGVFFGVGNFEREPNPTRDLVRVVEQCASGCAANGNIPGLVYRSQDFSDAHTGSYVWKASMSYVTGTHTMKVGHQHALMTDDRTWMTNNKALTIE